MKHWKNLHYKRGIHLDQMTPSEKLNHLAKALHPVATQHQLIRVGSEFDGGYLLPNDLDGIRACFSPGVNENASFEQHLHSQFGIGSHLADFSVDGPPSDFTPLSFTKKFIGATDDDVFMTMDTWTKSVDASPAEQDLLLQMDIEGYEYISLLRTSTEILKRFRIIIIEIHDVEAWGNPHFFNIVEGFFGMLLQHFWVVHNHPNNCCGIVKLNEFSGPRVFELTLLRKDRATPQGFCQAFPHSLDRPNLSNRDDLVLPAQWHG
ncbi:MAG: FkbM family methyltransferase [Limnohabitans sp.]